MYKLPIVTNRSFAILLGSLILWMATFIISPLTSNVQAAEDEIYTSFFSNHGAGGFDVTAYFDQGEPVMGNKKFKTRYKGADWLFVSQENLDKFTATPEKFAPQYGGYCAWAVAQGDLYKGDPMHWTIEQGKLYLNFDREVQTRWLTDVPGFIASANDQWPTILK